MANFSVGGDFPAIFCLRVGTRLETQEKNKDESGTTH